MPNTLNSSKKKPSAHSTLVSRNITVNGHRTSVRLEPAMWNGLTDICRREHITVHSLCSAVATQKSKETSLTAAIRVFIMAYYRAAATEEGHEKSGHGQCLADNAVRTLVQIVLDPSSGAPLPSPYLIGKAYHPPAAAG